MLCPLLLIAEGTGKAILRIIFPPLKAPGRSFEKEDRGAVCPGGKA